MNIIAHRGMWSAPAEQNTGQAFEQAFTAGFGIELDVRDHNGALVVSHDMPLGSPMLLADVLAMHQALAPHTSLAINIKADGLALPLKHLLVEYGTTEYFVFDMSVPDMRACLAAGLTSLARHSEFEPVTELHARAQGIWFDSFSWCLPDIGLISRCLSREHIACVVSAELHGHGHHAQWAMLAQLAAGQHEGRLMLCTDRPAEAQEMFND